MSRPTAWRLIKRVMTRANIQGRQATGKGLCHGFGVAMVTAGRCRFMSFRNCSLDNTADPIS